MNGLLVDPIQPLRARAQWAVTEGGRIGIAVPDPFTVEFIDETGSRRATRITHTPLRLTDGHKREWRESQSVVQIVAVQSRSGAVEMRRLRQPYTEPAVWPSTLPPFLDNALQFDGRDRLWIRRTTPPGEGATYDLVSPEGRIEHRVVLKTGERVVGLGRSVVYVVYADADELQYIARYQLP